MQSDEQRRLYAELELLASQKIEIEMIKEPKGIARLSAALQLAWQQIRNKRLYSPNAYGQARQYQFSSVREERAWLENIYRKSSK